MVVARSRAFVLTAGKVQWKVNVLLGGITRFRPTAMGEAVPKAHVYAEAL